MGAFWCAKMWHVLLHDSRGELLMGFEHFAPAANVRYTLRQLGEAFSADGQCEVGAAGIKGFCGDQRIKLAKPGFEPRQFGELTVAGAAKALHQCQRFCGLQTLVSAAAVGACEAAGTQLNAAVPADDQHHDLIEILAFNGGKNRSASGACRLAIIIEAVLLADFPRPAVVRSAEVAELVNELLRGSGAVGVTGECNEATFTNLFTVLAGASEGLGH